jgi:hypothetical protein
VPIQGRCHCGNIAFTYQLPPEPAEIPARECGCSFCVKHGGVWTSNPQATLRVTLQRPDEVARYAFGTRTADFHVCTRCGVVPLVTSRIEGRLYAVVNVNAFEEVPAARFRRSAADFEGEGEGARLARRARNWIGEVEFAAAGGASQR